MQVRNCIPEDVPLICDFVTKLADYEKLVDQVRFTEDLYRRYLFEDPPRFRPEVIIAQTPDGSPAGFALFIQISENAIHLEDLFVDPQMRGKGMGISLLSHLAKIGLSRGVSELQWNCLSWNQPSIDFYSSLGASQVPNRIAYRITGESLSKHVDDVDANNFRISHTPSGLCTPTRVTHVPSGVSLEYSLSFTTFNGTPVVYVTDVTPANCDIPDELVRFLIHEAQSHGYSRIDICLDSKTQSQTASKLIDRYGAVEMDGWIPFRLAGDHLKKLAQRANSA